MRGCAQGARDRQKPVHTDAELFHAAQDAPVRPLLKRRTPGLEELDSTAARPPPPRRPDRAKCARPFSFMHVS